MLGSSPAGITEWPLGLKVRTAASQAANVEFKSRRGHLWVGRIVAIAADCKSVTFETSLVRVQPAPPFTKRLCSEPLFSLPYSNISPLAHSALPPTLLYLTGDYYGKGIFKNKI